MLFSSIKKTVSSRLGVKSVLAVVVLITVISTILTSFFVARQKKLLTNELHERVRSIAHNLSYNATDYIITGNLKELYPLSKGVIKEKDIERTQIVSTEGTIIDHNDFGIIGKKFVFPIDKDFLLEESWFPTDKDYRERVIIPVEIKRRAVYKKNDRILYSQLENRVSQDSTTYIYEHMIFPSFSYNNNNVVFSALKENHSNKVVVSVNIENLDIEVLVEGGSHGRWSYNAQHFVFVTENKLAVYNPDTNKTKFICDKGIGRAGFPCFSYDDTSIITTLQTNPPDIFSERLFKIPLEGGEPEQLTCHNGQHWYPSCSSDGKWILYTDILNHIMYVYNIKTGKSSPLFPNSSRRNTCGSFSTDGKKICFYLNIKGYNEIFITDFPIKDNKQSQNNIYGTQLTSNGKSKWLPIIWSPDGKWLTYRQAPDIFILSTNGGIPINLTESLLKKEILGYAVLDISLESLNKAVAQGTRFAVIITVILLGFGTLGAIFLSESIVQPVRKLADATKEVARGKLDQTVSITRNDEIGILAESFNTMTAQLKNYREEIEDWNRELETKVTERTSELAEKHNELEKAYKELQTLDKAKDDFLSLVSHELRTPMSSILVFSEMLLNGVIDSKEKIDHIHRTIIKNCNRLSRLINDVLDLSKIEAGRMTFKYEILIIKDMIEETVGGFQSLIDDRNITVDYRDVPVDTFLLGDRDRIIQVLSNIISNAIKYNSESGSIIISLKSNSAIGTISIRDTGKGIPEEEIPKVFDRFHQLDNIDHHVNGTGLGMSISKSIIERQRGKIWIESEPGKGTTVFFTLPLADNYIETKLPETERIVTDTKKRGKLHKERSQSTILIADDDEEIRLALTECVTSAGYLSCEAGDGIETLRMVEHHRPHLVILDVMMPELSGLDVCRKLRENPFTKDIKIIMLSAMGQEREREEGLQAGADRYISKPFSYLNVIETIEKLLEK